MAQMGGGYLDPDPVIRSLYHGGLLNRRLQDICIGEGLAKLGVKAELQARITTSTCTVLSTASPRKATPYSVPLRPLHHDNTRLTSISSGLQQYATKNDATAFNRLKQMIQSPNAAQLHGGMASASSSLAGTPAPPSHNSAVYSMGGGPNAFSPRGHPGMSMLLQCYS